MSYADFVAYIGQINTPPGGFFTIGRWIELAKIQDDGVLLDLACSTGFSSRSIVQKTGCVSYGIDISKEAIDVANEKAKKNGLNNKLKYIVNNATELQFENQYFTHILAGCNFAFIQERRKALSECYRVLKSSGYLCTANFYYTTRPPFKLLDRVEKSISFRPKSYWDYNFWNSFLASYFLRITDECQRLPVLSDKQLTEAVRHLIYEKSEKLKCQNDTTKKACYRKLLAIRHALNEHRKYQNFNIAIWKPK